VRLLVKGLGEILREGRHEGGRLGVCLGSSFGGGEEADDSEVDGYK